MAKTLEERLSKLDETKLNRMVGDQMRKLPNLGESVEIADLLTVAYACGPDILVGVVRALDELNDLTGEKEGPSPEKQAAWAQIEAEAKKLVRKSSGKLTQSQAVAAFLETPEGRELWGQYNEH